VGPAYSSLVTRARGVRRAGSRGLSLIEIVVVLAIIALIMSVAVAGSMQTASARLRRSATMITSAIRVAFTRATATSRNLRLVMDIDQKKIWLEETDVPMLVQSKDTSGAAGAKAVSAAERAALAESDRIM
jgi:general secretion pathway protein H